MLNNIETGSSSRGLIKDEQNVHENENENEEEYRDIYALTPRAVLAPPSRRPSNLSEVMTNSSSENFSTMSREFNALVLAGSNIDHPIQNLDGIGEVQEDEEEEVINPLAIVPDTNPPLPSPVPLPVDRDRNRYRGDMSINVTTSTSSSMAAGEIGVHRAKKEEVEAKITAWETAKIAKINNRFKRDDAIISGWEDHQVHKASTWMKSLERKLEEKRAKAMEKMQNDIAKAHMKADERRASAEGKRGIKVAKVLQVSNLMRAVGKPPTKQSFF